MRDFLNISSLSNDDILKLIKQALLYKQQDTFYRTYSDKIICNLFFEDSTRTRASFEMAQLKLGFKTISFNPFTSSTNKGESLYDTCKTLESIGVNALVIRHSQNNFYEDLKGVNIPIINAGDGSSEHPSQCLLDLMSIYEHFNCFKDLKIAIVGDIKSSRVAKSNKIALERLGAKVYLVAPSIYKDENLGEYYKLNDVIKDLDVCMLLRIQHERHTTNELDFDKYRASFALTKNNYELLKSNAIIMHPAPVNRGVEIDEELIECPKSKIFTQMKNGVFARMSILDYIFKGE